MKKTLYNFEKETNYQFSKNYKPLYCFNDEGCHTGVLAACGLQLTTPLGEPGGHRYETLHLQQLFLLVQTVKMRTVKLSTLLFAVLLELPSSCRNDYEKLAMTANEMAGFYPAK